MKKDMYLMVHFDAADGLYLYTAKKEDFRASGLAHLSDLIGGREHLVRRRGCYYDAVAWYESEYRDHLGYYKTTRRTWRHVSDHAEDRAFGGIMTAGDILWEMTHHDIADLRMYADGEYSIDGDDAAIEILRAAAAELVHLEEYRAEWRAFTAELWTREDWRVTLESLARLA